MSHAYSQRRNHRGRDRLRLTKCDEMGNESAKPGIAVESTTLNESSVISQTEMLMAEATGMMDKMATEMMDKMELLDDRYKKLLATKAAQSKELKVLYSTCKKQCIEIDNLKALLVDKDKAESRAKNAELEATMAREKIVELENKLKAKEEEVGKVRSKINEAANSLKNWMEKIQKTLGPFDLTDIDFDSLNTSKVSK